MKPRTYGNAKPGYYKKCPQCQQFNHNPSTVCANCGHKFPEKKPQPVPKAPKTPVINYGSRQVVDWRMVTNAIRAFVALAGGIDEAKRLLDEAKRLGIIP